MVRKYLNKHFLYYVIIGAAATIVDTCIFYLVSEFTGLEIVFANWISLTIGILLSFYLNSHFNFKKKDKFIRRMFFFSVILIFGMIIGTSILYVLVNKFGFGKIFSKIISVIITGVFQYLFNSRITFHG
ncbi:MAG: GtrA family protein [Clostridia bacterium]|nr:GtrA family protein [Clostridia bacterium]